MIRAQEVILQLDPLAPYAEADRDFSVAFFMLSEDKVSLHDCCNCKIPREVQWQNSTDQMNQLGADSIVIVYDEAKKKDFQSLLAHHVINGPFAMALKKKDGTYRGFKDQKTAHNVAAWFISQQIVWGKVYHAGQPKRHN